MAREKPKEIQQLIDIGKEKGFLTYEEVNDVLPEDITSADQIDTVLSLFDEMDIEIIETDDENRPRKKSAPGKASPKKSTAAKDKEEEEDEEESDDDEDEE